MDVKDILVEAAGKSASDIFIISGAPLCYKANHMLIRMNETPLSTDDTAGMAMQIYELAGMRQTEGEMPLREMDFSFSIKGLGRFRANIYRQRGSFAAILRYVPFELPDAASLGIPEQVIRLGENKSGIVLITGPANSGKSTTLSCIIDRINKTKIISPKTL